MEGNAADDLSTKICVPNKTDKNVKAFNIITRINEAKTMVKDISCDCKCNLNSTTCNSKKKWNHESFQSECKKYVKKDWTYWNPSSCICQNGKF